MSYQSWAEEIGNVTITGLNLKSIKAFIQLKKPIRARLVYVERKANDGRFLGCYRVTGDNVEGYWYANGYRLKPLTLSMDEHRARLDAAAFRNMLTTTGLAQFRTVLKHMSNAGELERVGELLPLDKKQSEHFKVKWHAKAKPEGETLAASGKGESDA